MQLSSGQDDGQGSFRTQQMGQVKLHKDAINYDFATMIFILFMKNLDLSPSIIINPKL